MESRLSFFDRRAKNWEKLCYPDQVRARLCNLIGAFNVAPGEHLLDVGTGPGVLLPYLRDLVGPSGHLCAVDLSFEMVRQAHGKIGFPGDFIAQADVHRMPFDSNVFDRVICFAAFAHFNDPGMAIFEMGRILKPGGTLIVAHLMSREELADHHGRQGPVSHDLLPDDRTIRALFAQAGLTQPELVNRPGRYLAIGSKRPR